MEQIRTVAMEHQWDAVPRQIDVPAYPDSRRDLASAHKSGVARLVGLVVVHA